MTTKDTLTILREVEAGLKVLLPFELVQGDTIHRTSPASQQVCNSNIAWAVSNGERSAHKIRTAILALNEALPTIQELIRRASVGVDEYRRQVIGQATVTISRQEYESLKRPHLAPVASVDSKLLDSIKEIVALQCSGGNWNYDQYMQGIANGMIMILSMLENKEPEFLSAPDVWLKDLSSEAGTEGEPQPPQAKGAGE